MIASVGVPVIRERSVELTDLLIRLAMARDFEVRTPLDPATRGGTVTVFHPDGQRLAAELVAHDVLCDHRPGSGVRFGPHFFNTAEECGRAVDLLAELARR
jgi:kynureninase